MELETDLKKLIIHRKEVAEDDGKRECKRYRRYTKCDRLPQTEFIEALSLLLLYAFKSCDEPFSAAAIFSSCIALMHYAFIDRAS